MANYLENLDAARPVKTEMVVQAFKILCRDVGQLKAELLMQAWSVQENTNSVKDYLMNGSKGMTALEIQERMAIKVALNNLDDDVGSLKRCHCAHVDTRRSCWPSTSRCSSSGPAPRRGDFSMCGGCGDLGGCGDHGGGADVPKRFASSAGGNAQCHC